MKLTAQERADNWKAFRRMSAAQKADYIFSYYKLPIVLTLLFAYILCYGLYRHFTRKEVLLYVACANVVVSEETAEALSEGFVRHSGEDVRKCEVSLYQTLYLSENPTLANHEYAYASRLKLLAAIDAEQLDVVLMNQEAYDFLSEKEYLADIAYQTYQTNAVDVSRFPVFRDAGFTDAVFLGVIPNSPRMSAALEYIAYLESGG
ncbi:MAG: hypothetical protein IJQ81_04650 [Oscillibacter sp.]|nr:hypothetical protein [Oscillibacter sp.]